MNNRRRNWIIIVVVIGLGLAVGIWLMRVTLVCCALPPNTTATAIVASNQTIEAQIHQTETSTIQERLALTTTPTPSPLPYDPTLYAQRRHDELVLSTGAGPTQYAIFYATETAIVATYQGTNLPTFTPIPYNADMSPTAIPLPSYTPTPTPSPTVPPSVHDSNCAFSWAHQDLPDIAEAAREAFSSISSTTIQVLRVDAYGENCNRADGSLSYFAAMTTDFYLSTNVTNPNDMGQIAQVVMTAYGVITELKIKLPARAGYLDIMFTAGSQTKHFRAMFDQLKPAIEAGKNGADVLEIGGLSP